MLTFMYPKKKNKPNKEQARTNWQRTISEWWYHTGSASVIAIINGLLCGKVKNHFRRNENERSYG